MKPEARRKLNSNINHPIILYFWCIDSFDCFHVIISKLYPYLCSNSPQWLMFRIPNEVLYSVVFFQIGYTFLIYIVILVDIALGIYGLILYRILCKWEKYVNNRNTTTCIILAVILLMNHFQHLKLWKLLQMILFTLRHIVVCLGRTLY